MPHLHGAPVSTGRLVRGFRFDIAITRGGDLGAVSRHCR
jgi:hypothetical protein